MDIPKDDFKWFGEGFDGFPKRLPDDTIEYTLHVLSTKYSDSQSRTYLNSIIQASNLLTKKLLKKYIWQREEFKLSLVRESNSWILSGRTGFGDSVADEWVVVYLLRELSRQFPEAWVRMYDTDGEFLLVEAAGALQKWLNPEIAEHRVWINQGRLLIIPLEKANPNLTREKALETIARNPNALLHSPLVEEEAFYRLQDYPKAIAESMHSALLTIPRKLSYILHAKPSFTSAAIEAFYLRDPISLKPLQQPTLTALKFPPTDFVTLSARFNKVSYAQLKSQDFPPPRTWTDVFPSSADPAEAARREIGLKLACGFEMLLQDPQNRDKQAVREINLLLDDLEIGEEVLPTDEVLASWPKNEDSESWLDINFEDFERELAGKRGGGGGADTSSATPDGGPAGGGFGDKSAQENLRKMVSRFETFMNDDTAGPEGAEMDDMDFDDASSTEDSDSEESDSEDSGEDRAVSFDEEEFARMMREMMGMPAEKAAEAAKSYSVASAGVENVEDSEDEEICELARKMEAELNETGALDLNPTPGKMKALSRAGEKGKGKGKESVERDSDEESGDDEEEGDVDIDYNLVQNMLEAFKGQTGMAGPAGNMLGAMGIQMPRDERESKE